MSSFKTVSYVEQKKANFRWWLKINETIFRHTIEFLTRPANWTMRERFVRVKWSVWVNCTFWFKFFFFLRFYKTIYAVIDNKSLQAEKYYSNDKIWMDKTLKPLTIYYFFRGKLMTQLFQDDVPKLLFEYIYCFSACNSISSNQIYKTFSFS